MSNAQQDLAEARAAREERRRKVATALYVNDLASDLHQHARQWSRVLDSDGRPVVGVHEQFIDGQWVVVLTTGELWKTSSSC
jgi:hypothetical protein